MLVRNMRLVLSYKSLYNDKFVFSIIQMSSFMQPISFARSFLSKGLSKSVGKASVASKILQSVKKKYWGRKMKKQRLRKKDWERNIEEKNWEREIKGERLINKDREQNIE